MFRGLDHIELIVRDVEATTDFYQRLGFEFVRETDHHERSRELRLPPPSPLVVEMHEPEMEENIGINHVAYRVSNMDAAVEALQAAGAKLEKAPVVAKHTGRKLANFRDAEGWRLQIVMASEEEVERNAREATSAGPALWLDHIDMYVPDLDSSVEFYKRAGVRELRELEGGEVRAVELELNDDPASTIELKQVGGKHVIGINHLGFAVENLDAAVASLREAGYRSDYEPRVAKATQRYLCTFRDPDGWRVQLTEVEKAK